MIAELLLGTDIWRIGIVRAPAPALLAPGALARAEIVWLPAGRPFTFLADPFGLWRDGMLHIFAEAYDYRGRHGIIDVLRLDAELRLIDRRTCLAEPWHLSYPCVFEADGETWLLPEAFRTGCVMLYRSVGFPDRWEPAARIVLDAAPVDATPFRHDGLWWLAYAPGGGKAARQGRLHFAFAERLVGPWRSHPGNPVRVDRSGARPGGSAMMAGGTLVLPVQDCARTYGAALRPLFIHRLTTAVFEAEAGPPLDHPASAGAFRDGLHTLSACGEVSLIDVKRIDRTLGGRTVDALRLARRAVGPARA